ncbi:unnamed protein product [Calypogeia fissa]
MRQNLRDRAKKSCTTAEAIFLLLLDSYSPVESGPVKRFLWRPFSGPLQSCPLCTRARASTRKFLFDSQARRGEGRKTETEAKKSRRKQEAKYEKRRRKTTVKDGGEERATKTGGEG